MSRYYTDIGIETLEGLTISDIGVNDYHDKIIFKTSCGRSFEMYHAQCCCEKVYIDEIIGNLDDLIGSPILEAEEVSK